MPLTVPAQWTATAHDQDAEILTFPAAQDWLIAVIGCRVTDGSTPLLSLGDVSRNLWTPVMSQTGVAASAHAGAQLQVEVWACPAARYDGWTFLAAYVSAMQIAALDVGTLLVNVFEIAGMGNGTLTVDSVTVATASAAASITLTAPAPSGAVNCLMVAGAVADVTTAVTPSGTGWAALTSVSATAPNTGLAAAWREATTGGAATFTLASGTANWAGVVVAIRQTGIAPTQPNPAWPATQLQFGLGYDLSTPLPRVYFTDQTTRYFDLAGDRGIQDVVGAAQQGQAAVGIRNDDGALTPRAVALSASASAAGTTTTIKILDAGAVNIHITDFFRLKTSGGVLKQFDVFQVTAISSAAGTTTVTFTRADGSGAGALVATATGDVYAGIAIDLYIPYRLLKTIGTGTAAKTYIALSGWLTDLQIGFTDDHWSEIQAQATDALETLTAAEVSALRGEIMRRRGLYAYWPLDDAAGSGYAENVVSVSALVQTVSKFGAGTATADFGAATQGVATNPNSKVLANLLGDPGTGWAQNGQTSAEMNANKGYALIASDAGFPVITGGVTVCGAILLSQAQLNTVGASTVDPTIFIIKNGDPGAGTSAGAVLKLSFTRAGLLPVVTVWDKATHALTSTTVGGVQIVGVDWQSWAVTFNATSWAVYINGFLSGTGAANLVSAFSQIDVGGEADQFFTGKSFPGTHAHIAMYGRRLTVEEITQINQATNYGNVIGDNSDNRIARKLNTVGWQGTRVLQRSVSRIGPEDAPSGSVGDAASEIAGYQDSLVFVDAASQLQYRERARAYRQLPRAVLGENTAAGEIPCQPGMVFSYNSTFVYSSATAENTGYGGYGAIRTTRFVAVNDASRSKYLTRTLIRPTRFYFPEDAWHLTWWWLGRYAYPQLRVGTVTVSAAATSDTARWAFVCGVEVGDLVTVNRRPIGQPMISVRCRVMAVRPAFSRRAGTVTGQVTLILAAAPPIVAIANDATYGTLAGTVMGA